MSDHDTDPAVLEAVQNIANRFGVPGLEALIVAADEELVRARAALAELAELADDPA